MQLVKMPLFRPTNLLLIMGTSFLFSNEPCPPIDDPCCPPPDPCAKCAQIWPSQGPDWIITPSAGPCVDRGFDAHATVEFIYWSVREDQLGFAIKESIQTLPDNQVTLTSQGNTFHPDWHFEPGFKIGLGVLRDHDGWDLYLKYTWLRVRDTKRRVQIEDTNTQRIRLVGGLAENPGVEQVVKATARWQLDFDVLDAELGRNFFISRYLILRPFVSMKGTWQDQSYQVTSIGIAPQYNVAENGAEGISNQSLHYWGVGIRGGVNSAWHFTRCWSLFGEMAVTGLWEQFESRVKATRALLTPQSGSPPVTTLYTENCFSTIKPIIEMILGLRYENWYCCDTLYLALSGGWEIQWWKDQNQFFDPARESRLGDLLLTGLNLKLRLDF